VVHYAQISITTSGKVNKFSFSIIKFFIFIKKLHPHHSRSSSASSFLTNASSSQGYMSARGSPTNSVANCTLNSSENDTLIAKVQLVGRNDLLYKKVRVSKDDSFENRFNAYLLLLNKIKKDYYLKLNRSSAETFHKEIYCFCSIIRLEIMNEHQMY
jgi:hypothetical protein